MKRIFRGISLGLLVAPAAIAGLCVVAGTLLLLSYMIDMCMARIAQVVPQIDPFLQERCERDPTTIHRNVGKDLAAYFYDADTLQPADKNNPPIDTELLRRWKAGEPAPGRMLFLHAEGGLLLRRVAPSGPCSLLELHWTLAKNERRQFVVVVVGLVALSVLVAMGTAIFVAVRPLLLRIARLRQATQRLGQSAGYASAADPEADDLGQLSILLDQAHTRIAADAERATNRQKSPRRALGQCRPRFAHATRLAAIDDRTFGE